MKTTQAIIISIVLLTTSSAFSNAPPPTWSPYSPYTGYLGNIDEVHIGFGDWCTMSEGPHPGIDFGDPDQNSGTMVYSPCGTAGTVEWAGYYIDPAPSDNKGMVVCVAKPGEDWGWGVAHLDPGNDPWQYAITGLIPAFAPMEITFDMSQSNPDWEHVHLYWIHRDPPSGMGFYNPFNYLAGSLVGYDEVCFGSPQYIENSPLLPDNGIYFSPDEAEHPNQFDITAMLWTEFQEIVFGKVDVSVRPYSAFQGLSGNDICGVNTIGYKILWQNPYNEDNEAYEDIVLFNGNYRLLVSMDDGEMIEGDSEKYRAAFLDGNVIGCGDPQLWDGFNTSYIVTNSGTQTMTFTDNFNSGWDNVWTDVYDRAGDWNSGQLLRGAWDTRLCIESADPAQYSAQAEFPDGRYAFDIKALSQATAFLSEEHQEWGQQVMPCEDPGIPGSTVTGVVVDNFRPFVDSLFVYSMLPKPKVYFTAGWELYDIIHTATYHSTTYGYIPHGEVYGTQDMWIAVKYSEPMDISLCDIWITAEMEGEEQWSSENWGYFRPEPVLENWFNGEPDQGQHSGGTWALYRLHPIGAPISEYKGRLTLHISHSDTLTDLAGNSIDGDPSTIAYPRDETTGQWNDTNYDAEDDDSYTWGEPDWDTSEIDGRTYYIATVGENKDEVFSIWVGTLGPSWVPWWDRKNQAHLYGNDSSFENDIFLDETREFTMVYHSESCPYYCGCWAVKATIAFDSTMAGCFDMSAAVIRPQEEDPVVINRYIHESGYILGCTSWFCTSFVTSEAVWIITSPENEIWNNRYFWFRDRYGHGQLSQPESGYSYEKWKCIDSHTGTFMSTTLSRQGSLPDTCCSWFDEITGELYYVNYNYDSMEEHLQPDGNMLVPAYYVFYDYTHPFFMGNVSISPPGRDYQRSQLLLNAISSASDTISAEESISILPNANPIRGEITLSVYNCMGENYEVRLYDLSGREVAMQSGIMFANNEQLHLGTAHIPEGLYFVTATIGDCRLTQKVTVLR